MAFIVKIELIARNWRQLTIRGDLDPFSWKWSWTKDNKLNSLSCLNFHWRRIFENSEKLCNFQDEVGSVTSRFSIYWQVLLKYSHVKCQFFRLTWLWYFLSSLVKSRIVYNFGATQSILCRSCRRQFLGVIIYSCTAYTYEHCSAITELL